MDLSPFLWLPVPPSQLHLWDLQVMGVAGRRQKEGPWMMERSEHTGAGMLGEWEASVDLQGWDRHTSRGVEAGECSCGHVGSSTIPKGSGVKCLMTHVAWQERQKRQPVPRSGGYFQAPQIIHSGLGGPENPEKSLALWPASRQGQAQNSTGWNCSPWHGLWTLAYPGTRSESCLIPLLSLGLQGPPSSTLHTHPRIAVLQGQLPSRFISLSHLCS